MKYIYFRVETMGFAIGANGNAKKYFCYSYLRNVKKCPVSMKLFIVYVKYSFSQSPLEGAVETQNS